MLHFSLLKNFFFVPPPPNTHTHTHHLGGGGFLNKICFQPLKILHVFQCDSPPPKPPVHLGPEDFWNFKWSKSYFFPKYPASKWIFENCFGEKIKKKCRKKIILIERERKKKSTKSEQKHVLHVDVKNSCSLFI